MSAARPYCDICKRGFVDTNAFWQHNKFTHRLGKVENPHPAAWDDVEQVEVADGRNV